MGLLRVAAGLQTIAYTHHSMNSPLPKAWSYVRRVPHHLQLLGLWMLTLTLVEVGVRASPNDGYDGIAVAAVLITCLWTWGVHRRSPLPGLDRFAAQLRKRLKQVVGWDIESGIDFRITPPIPPGFPASLKRLLLLSATSTLVLAVNHELFLSQMRGTLQEFSSALWILGLTCLWSVLICSSLIGFGMLLCFTHEALKFSTRFGARGRLHAQACLIAGHLALLALGVWVLPAWLPLAFLALALSATSLVVLLPGCPALSILWRDGPNSPTRVAQASTMTMASLALWACTTASLYLISCGEQLQGVAGGTTPATTLLGLILAWTMTVLFCAACGITCSTYLMGRNHDPAKTWPGRVHLSGAMPPEARRLLNASLLAAGLRLVPSDKRPRRGDVELHYREGATVAPFGSVVAWPLLIGPAHLVETEHGLPRLVERVNRRDQVLRRRHLMHGLKRLFKLARSRKPERGTGFWVAPQHWFIPRFARDGDDEHPFAEGPQFSPTLPIRSRAHFHEVMRGCGLDILFVEDGVSFRRVKRVFAMLFEYHDLFGGVRPAEERHFSGLPGIRVIIHDQELTQQRPKGRYPEPDYDGLGRSRVLHIFKDRGDEDEQTAAPAMPDFEIEPVLFS